MSQGRQGGKVWSSIQLIFDHIMYQKHESCLWSVCQNTLPLELLLGGREKDNFSSLVHCRIQSCAGLLEYLHWAEVLHQGYPIPGLLCLESERSFTRWHFIVLHQESGEHCTWALGLGFCIARSCN